MYVGEKRRHKVCTSLQALKFLASGIMVYVAECGKICLKYGSATNKSKCHMATIFINGKEALILGILYTCWSVFKIMENFIVRAN